MSMIVICTILDHHGIDTVCRFEGAHRNADIGDFGQWRIRFAGRARF